jgi:hypothetical protein
VAHDAVADAQSLVPIKDFLIEVFGEDFADGEF